MKRAAFLLISLGILSIQAQTTSIPATTPIPPSTTFIPPSTTFIPPLIPGMSGITFTNEFGQPATMDDLTRQLISLQNTIEQTLPVLIGFNNSFEFVNLSVGGLLTGTILVPNTTTTFSQNNGVNIAVPFSGASGPVPNTVGAAGVPISRETLRALLFLQNDMERMLPTLIALNGGTNPVATPFPSQGSSFVPGGFTNSLTPIRTQPLSPLTNGFITPLMNPGAAASTSR